MTSTVSDQPSNTPNPEKQALAVKGDKRLEICLSAGLEIGP
jgi:hypothetical protein